LTQSKRQLKCLCVSALLCLSVVTIEPSFAQEKSLTVEFSGIEGDLLENVKRNVRLLVRQQDGTPLGEGERRRLQRRAYDEIKQALEPFGYYQVDIVTEFDRAASSLRYRVELNEPVLVKSISLQMADSVLLDQVNSASLVTDDVADAGSPTRRAKSQNVASFRNEFEAWRNQFELKVGARLDHASYELNKKRLLANALRQGYFDAQYTKSLIEIGTDRESADIQMMFAPGARYKISKINLNWQYSDNADEKTRRGIDADILSSLITLQVGQYYTSERLSETQRNLSATPFFSNVEVTLGDLNSSEGLVPVVINLTPRKRKAYNFQIGVGTDTGVRASVGYENRKINTKGHNISARYGASEINRSASFNYRIPQFRSQNESVNLFAALTDAFGNTRRFQSSTLGAELSHELEGAVVTYGVTASREQYRRLNRQLDDVERTTDLLIPRVQWKFTEVDDLYFPTNGWSATIELRASSEDLLSDVSLLQGELDIKRLFPLGNGSLKLRMGLSGSLISESADLPESLGFLAGGDDSVRGYAFESIGVNRNGETTVGKHAVVGSIEYQHPIRDGLALATFVDIGDAFDNKADFKKGVGVGLRWRLPFGALRLDLASALDLEGDPLRLHFSFGTDL
jgi:translocation and assembly module TamA